MINLPTPDTTYADALALLAQHAVLQPVETIAAVAALNRVTDSDIHAAVTMPPFDNSAMDGFALYAADTQNAKADQPLTLPVAHRLAAGDVLSTAHSGQAVEIMTGAKVPAGCDTVIPIEHVRCQPDAGGMTQEIELSAPVPVNSNIRRAGEDFAAGDLLIKAGTRLTAGHIAALLASGNPQVSVYVPPSIAVLTTGKEIVSDYARPLREGEIYNSNTPYLLNQLQAAGLPAHDIGPIGDDPARFAQALREHTTAQILISTGAVSKGQWDFIPDVLREQSAEIIFHRVAIKPGKPVLFARLADDRYFFGLPGNPVSAAVGLRFFVQPLIRALLGLSPEVTQSVPLATAYRKKGKLRHFLKARVLNAADGQHRLEILNGQESFKIAPMLAMNCWAVLPEDAADLSAGSPVSIVSTALFPNE